MTRRLCGFRPTGQLHIGHKIAVIDPALAGADVLVAVYHAGAGNNSLIAQSIRVLRTYGVPSERIVMQDKVFDSVLYFKLMHLAKTGRLHSLTQYKHAPQNERTAHLLTYPVLMAHDVAGYDEIVVGPDQKQHLEYARDLLSQLGLKKLDDSPREIEAKIKRAVSTNAADPSIGLAEDAGITNLEKLYRIATGRDCNADGLDPRSRTGEFKEQLAAALISFLALPE